MDIQQVVWRIESAFPNSPESEALSAGDNEKALDFLRRRIIADGNPRGTEPNTAEILYGELLGSLRQSNR
jgi:hypothetical protein